MSALPQLLLQKVALCSADPSRWACTSRDAHSTLNQDPGGVFELEWFLKWQPILLPHRPWQYAVLTWRRMNGAPPRRIAQFMLAVLQAKQQQEQGRPKQQGEDAASVAYKRRYEDTYRPEGQFYGRFPSLQPLPSTLRKVHKLLAKQQAAADLQALLLLCPCAMSLFAQYSARDQTAPDDTALQTWRSSDSSSSNKQPMPLMQRVLQHVRPSGAPTMANAGNTYFLYARYLLTTSSTERSVDLHKQGCFGAVAAGCVPTLLLRIDNRLRVLQGHREKPVQLQQLLTFAARYSNATCLRAVFLQYTPAQRWEALAPQHMAMAAARTDPWAPDVVELLMQLLSPKQLKPSNMQPAYKAACITGYLPVLQLLLAHAASAPEQHLAVLLESVAASGNSLVCELLLGDTQLALQQLQLQLQQPQQQQSTAQLAGVVQALRAVWSNSDVQQVKDVLRRVLPVTSAQGPTFLTDTQDQALRLQVADLLWQALPGDAQAAVQQPGQLQTDATAACPPQTAGVQTGGMDFLPDDPSFKRNSQAARMLWLWQHRVSLAPPSRHMEVRRIIVPVAISFSTQAAKLQALQTGTQHAACMALQLHHKLQHRYTQLSAGPSGAADGSPDSHAASQSAVDDDAKMAAALAFQSTAAAKVATAMATIDGRVLAACSACNAAALDQLETLYMMCFMLLTPPAFSRAQGTSRPATTASTAPTLPVSRLNGKVVTVAHLSAGLGLPWPLLGTLLAAAGYHNLHPAMAAQPSPQAGTSSSSQLPADIQQQLADAMFAAQNGEAAMQAGVLVSHVHPPVRHDEAVWNLQDEPETLQQIAAARLHLLQPCTASSVITDTDLRFDRLVDLVQGEPKLAGRLQSAFWHGFQQLTSLRERRGPPPLWQQALLQVVTQQAQMLRPSRHNWWPHGAHGHLVVFQGWAAAKPTGLTSAACAPGLLLAGLQAGRSAQEVQQLISSRLLQCPTGPHHGPSVPSHAPWGRHIMREALIHREPELLAWALAPEQQQLLWGSGAEAVSDVVSMLATQGCSPINCRSEAAFTDYITWQGSVWCGHRTQQDLQQQDLTELQQQREQLLGPAGAAVNSSCGPIVAAAGPLPQFACSAVQMAMLLLKRPNMPADTLDKWLRFTVGVRSSLPDLVRARTIVAAVAASEVIPAGARVLHREAARQVLAVSDPDLWSVVLLWAHRLPLVLHGGVDEFGFPVGDWDDDFDDDAEGAGDGGVPEGVAELVAAVNAVNI